MAALTSTRNLPIKAQCVLLISLTSVFIQLTGVVWAGKISEELLLKVHAEGATNAVLEIPSTVDELLNGKTFQDTMSAPTSKSQAPFLRVLQKQRFSPQRFTLFWTTNNIFIQNITSSEVYSFMFELQGLNFTLREPLNFVTPGKFSEPTEFPKRQERVLWGIGRTEAPLVWKTYNNRGQGVTVASIDTGVDGTHPVLVDNFRGGSWSWHDPVFGTNEPSDYSGHGTHTLGTILGKGGYGVAPDAQWIACRAIAGDVNKLEERILNCFDWIIGMANLPDVIFLGFTAARGSQEFFRHFLEFTNLNNIVVVAPIGDNGPDCQTVTSPGDIPDVIGVAATDEWDRVLPTSSRGLSTIDILEDTKKPDISAPGADIESAYLNGGYRTGTGTSMSAAHVAGVTALVLSEMKRCNFTNYDNEIIKCDKYKYIYWTHGVIKDILTNSTYILPDNEKKCGTNYHNDNFSTSTGWGIIDAYKAIQRVHTNTYYYEESY